MGFLRVLTIILVVFLVGVNGQNNSFNNYYKYLWGNDHFIINPQGTQVQLKMDKTSGTYTFLRTVDLQSLIISRITIYAFFVYTRRRRVPVQIAVRVRGFSYKDEDT